MSSRKSDLLSAHARAEIDHWLTRYPADRKQSAVLAALREVQHELRAGIDRLGNILAAVNIAAVPALLVIVAIVLGVLRRRRMAAAQAAV